MKSAGWTSGIPAANYFVCGLFRKTCKIVTDDVETDLIPQTEPFSKESYQLLTLSSKRDSLRTKSSRLLVAEELFPGEEMFWSQILIKSHWRAYVSAWWKQYLPLKIFFSSVTILVGYFAQKTHLVWADSGLQLYLLFQSSSPLFLRKKRETRPIKFAP